MGWFGAGSKSGRPVVLHVDDSQTVLAVTKLMLETLGLDVIQTGSGMDGIKIAERDRPALILLDAMMPGIDGYETCIALKRNPKTKDIPVIMVTGMDAVKDVEKAMAVGANSYLIKPIQQDRLKAKIESFIKPPAAPGAPA